MFYLKSKKNLIGIILSIIVVLIISLFNITLAVGISFLIFLAVITPFLFRIFGIKIDKALIWLFLIVLLIHLGAVLFIHYAHFQPFNDGGGDFTAYQQRAQEIAEMVRQGNFSLEGVTNQYYYSVIVGYIYALTLPKMLIGQLFNAWLVALLIIFVYLIVLEIGGTEKEGFLMGLIASVYPSLVFYGSLLLKDALVITLSMLGLFLMIKTIKNFSILKFLGFFIVLTLLLPFRFYIGYAIIFSFIISWFLASNFNLKRRITYGIIMIFILGFCPLISGSGYYGFSNLKSFLTPETITYYREVAYAVPVQPVVSEPVVSEPVVSEPVISEPVVSEPVVSEPVISEPVVFRSGEEVVKTRIGNLIVFVKSSIPLFIYSFLGPFPWQLTHFAQFLVLPEMLAWYFLLFFIIKGIINSVKKQNKTIIPLILFSFFVFGVLAIFINNFGIITRIRIPAFLALLCLFPLGFERLKNIKIPFLNI